MGVEVPLSGVPMTHRGLIASHDVCRTASTLDASLMAAFTDTGGADLLSAPLAGD